MSDKSNPEEVSANMQLLSVLVSMRQGHETMIATALMVLVAANAGIFAVGESVAKAAGPMAIAFLGVATVVISFLTIWPRRERLQVLRKRIVDVETALTGKVTLYATLNEEDASDMTVSRLVHLAVLLFWIAHIFYNWHPGLIAH